MYNIKLRKFIACTMLVSFLSSILPSFAAPIRPATVRAGSTTKKTSTAPRSVNLVGDVNLKQGNQKISVSLRDSDVKQVLRMFADKAGLNVVFHNSVDGKVTLDLVNVTLNNAFKMVMEASELAYYIENDTLIVTSKEADKTVGLSKSKMMVLPLKYIDSSAMADFLNANIFGTGRPGLSNGDVVVTNPRTNELLIFGSDNDYRVAKEVVAKMDIKPSIATFKVNHVTPKEMAKLVCNTIFASNDDDDSSNSDSDSDSESDSDSDSSSSSDSDSEDSGLKLGTGKVSCKVKTELESSSLKALNMNAITVLYYPELGNVGLIGGSVEQIQLVEEFIKTNDKKQPQAFIEFQMIELTESGQKTFDNTWQIWSPFLTATFTGTGGLTTNELYPTFWAGSGYTKVKVDDSGITKLYDITKYNGPFMVNQSIHYLITNNKGRTLANPKVVVTNGKTTTIDLSSDYVKRVTSQVVGSSIAGTIQRTYEIANDNGIKITLTPYISEDGYVSMTMNPNYATTAEVVRSGSDIVATLLHRRNLTLNNIRIKDGETLVIGGLVQEEDKKNTGKLPILGDIPVLGMFFRSSSDAKTKTELLILVTPHIIKDTEDIQQANVVDL